MNELTTPGSGESAEPSVPSTLESLAAAKARRSARSAFLQNLILKSESGALHEDSTFSSISEAISSFHNSIDSGYLREFNFLVESRQSREVTTAVSGDHMQANIDRKQPEKGLLCMCRAS
jgi:hypothetical protein